MKKDNNLKLIRNKFTEHFYREYPGAFCVTGITGIQTVPKNKFWKIAAEVGASGKPFLERSGNCWLPVFFEGEVIAVCGFKNQKRIPTEIIKVLHGLVSQISHDQYLAEMSKSFNGQKNAFITKLLTRKSYHTVEEIMSEADILGLNLRPKQAVILCQVSEARKGKKTSPNWEFTKTNFRFCPPKMIEKIIGFIDEAYDHQDQNVFAQININTVACLVGGNEDTDTNNSIKFYKDQGAYIQNKVRTILGADPTIGIGLYYPGIGGLKKSYESALASMDIGEKIWGRGGVYHISDIGMFVALSDKISFDHKREITHRSMGRIFADPCLLKTLTVYFNSNMNLSVAAKKLHLHRNTLIYRLTKIHQLIQLSPQKFNDAVKIKLGLLLFDPHIGETIKN